MKLVGFYFVLFAILFSCKESNDCENVNYETIPVQNRINQNRPNQNASINCYLSNYEDHLYPPEGLSIARSWSTLVQLKNDSSSCIFIDSVFFNDEKMFEENFNACYYSLGEAPPSSSYPDSLERNWQLYDSQGAFLATVHNSGPLPFLDFSVDNYVTKHSEHAFQLSAQHADFVMVSLGPINKTINGNSNTCLFLKEEINCLECGKCPYQIIAYSEQDTIIDSKTVSIIVAQIKNGMVTIHPLLEE
jgi:hypothetical protein